MELFFVTPFVLGLGLSALAVLIHRRKGWLVVILVVGLLGTVCFGLSELFLSLRDAPDGNYTKINYIYAYLQNAYLLPMCTTFVGGVGLVFFCSMLHRVPEKYGICISSGLLVLALVGAVATDFGCVPYRLQIKGDPETYLSEREGVPVYRSTIAGWCLWGTSFDTQSKADVAVYSAPDESSELLEIIPTGATYTQEQLPFTRPTAVSGWRFSEKHDGFVRTEDLVRAFPGVLERGSVFLEDTAAVSEGRFVSGDLWRVYYPVNTGVAVLMILMVFVYAVRRKCKKSASAVKK